MALPLRYNVLSMLARRTSTVTSVGLVAVVIAAFAYLQAVTDSAFNTLAATGDPRTVIVLAQSAESETVSRLGSDELNKLDATPGAVRDAAGPLISPETVAIASAFTHEDDRVAVNTAVRGVDFDKANQVRHGKVRIIRGRAFQPGTLEVIVGQAASRLYRNYNVGDEILLGARGIRAFKIVGIFSAGGSAADSEIWGYLETIRDVYGRGGYSSARMLAADEQSGRQMMEFIKGPAVGLAAKAENEYFRDLNTGQTATYVLSIAMIIIMGTAAAFAVANAMYAAVAGRTREIGMLRSLGFARTSILTGFVVEGLLLAAAGGVLGCLLSLVVNGWQRNMLPGTFTTVSYSLEITPKIVGTCLAVAVAIGLAGSVFPAWRAARLDVMKALREA